MANGQIYVDAIGRAYREYNGQLVPAVPLTDPSYGLERSGPVGKSIFGGKVFAQGAVMGGAVGTQSIYPRAVTSPDQQPQRLVATSGMGLDQPAPIPGVEEPVGRLVPVVQGPGGQIAIQRGQYGMRLPVSAPMGRAVSRSIFGEPVYAEDTPGGVTLAYGGRRPTPEIPAGNRGIFNEAGEELDGVGSFGSYPGPQGSRGGGRRRRYY